ncbi:MAG: L-glutamate gamma-semialdehyde dehydrogenase [bacterium]
MLPEFRNEPLTDFSLEANRKAFQQALDKIQSELGQKWPVIIDGQRKMSGQTFARMNPAKTSEVIAEFAKGTKEMALEAVQAADKRFDDWSHWEPEARARILLRAAALMRRRKHEFSATMVLEVGKNWVEADADTAEAIDFLEFYAREMMRLAEPQPLVSYPGEEENLYYIPLGVGAVIPPWNFPLAILVGMTTAALVAGNTVVLKPASASPFIAWRFHNLLEEAGLPAGVLNFLPGSGAAIGDTIVGHPRTRFIAFTGSKEVGLHIHRLAAELAPGQIWVKRTILEMGGKDCILVDESANPEEAAKGIYASAFGFQGQKCSACSRAIVHKKLYDDVVARVVEMAKKTTIGPTKDYGNYLGPVVDEAAFVKTMEYIEIGKKEGKLLCGGERGPAGGWFIQPTIFGDIGPEARIFQEEIFAPVLAFSKAESFQQGIDYANKTEYGLTGALYSNDRHHLEIARRDFHVGNLYFNRKCTGALVGAQPFGGFNMSGTDSKAGGRDYLLLFTQAKCVSERF